jgi:hypothetical protein
MKSSHEIGEPCCGGKRAWPPLALSFLSSFISGIQTAPYLRGSILHILILQAWDHFALYLAMQACETSPQRSNEHKQQPNNQWISINQLANQLSISICSCTNPNEPSWCVSWTLKKRPNRVAPTVPSLNDSPHDDTIPSSLSRPGSFWLVT